MPGNEGDGGTNWVGSARTGRKTRVFVRSEKSGGRPCSGVRREAKNKKKISNAMKLRYATNLSIFSIEGEADEILVPFYYFLLLHVQIIILSLLKFPAGVAVASEKVLSKSLVSGPT